MKNQQRVTGYVQADDADEVFCVNEALKVNFAENQRNEFS